MSDTDINYSLFDNETAVGGTATPLAFVLKWSQPTDEVPSGLELLISVCGNDSLWNSYISVKITRACCCTQKLFMSIYMVYFYNKYIK